jgi:RNA polymerase sigma factor (sigma-70 family)
MIPDESTIDHAFIRAAMEQYEGPLLRYASRLLSDADMAKDVVQDVFLRLCRQELSKVENHLAEWLFTVCRRRVVDHFRKGKRMNPLEADTYDKHASPEPSPNVVVERKEASDRVLKLITKLPTKQQEVVCLKFQNGFSYKEISGITELSVSNVGFLLHTALKTLRKDFTKTSEIPFSLKGASHEN